MLLNFDQAVDSVNKADSYDELFYDGQMPGLSEGQIIAIYHICSCKLWNVRETVPAALLDSEARDRILFLLIQSILYLAPVGLSLLSGLSRMPNKLITSMTAAPPEVRTH